MNNTFNLLMTRSTNGRYLNGIIIIFISIFFFYIILYNIIMIVAMKPHKALSLPWKFIKKNINYSLNKNTTQCETFLVNIFKTNLILNNYYIYINFYMLWLITTLKFIQL
jgi:hypothetical protein